jgi:hypothetical protein
MIASLRGRALAALAAAPVLLACSTQAAFGAGQTGSAAEAGVTCYANPQFPANNRVIAQAPSMSSSPVAANGNFTVGGGMFGGGYHVQQVGYRAYLYRWNGAAWRYTGRYGPLLVGQTADAMQPVLWRGASNTVFGTPGHGSYRVFMRYYWFADALAAGGSSEAFAQIYEQGRARYCHF